MFSLNLKPILVLFFISIGIKISSQTPVKQNYTDNLLRQAKSAEINAFLHKSEHQCDNFYREVCGNWKLTYPATYTNLRTSYLEQFKDFYTSKCLDLIKSDWDGRNYHKMLKNFFQSCTIEKHKVKRGLEAVLSNVVNFKGGWPKITSLGWYEDGFDWLKVVAQARRKLGVDIFIGLDISPDLDGRALQRIEIGAPKLPLGGRNVYYDEDFETKRDDYKLSIAKKLRDYYTTMPENWADEVASQVLDVERKLAKGFNEKDLPKRNTTREQTVSQLKTAYGNYVDLNSYLTAIFSRTVSETIYESPLNYMTNLVDVIKNTPKLTIANYTMWRVLETLDFAGGQNNENNDKFCINKVKHFFPKHVEDMFEQGFNSMEFGYSLNAIFEEIKTTFKGEFAGLNWMSATTRQKALEKLQEMKLDLVHHYHGKLEEEVQDLIPQITSDNYYNNMLNVLECQTKLELGKLQQKFELPEETSNTFPKYIHKENKIQIPVMFMQPRVLWDPAYPNALKYSTVGVLIAQQMLHGFFGEGTEYDKRGDPNPWWDEETKVAYKELAECFQRQYSNYKFQGKLVNDPEALSKAIVFTGALKIAYHTYHDWMNSAKADVLGKESLPNVDYKPHQFFFLGYGQMFCADYHLSVVRYPRIPERLLVNGAVANLEEFGKEFNCQQGTKMNPTNKCTLF